MIEILNNPLITGGAVLAGASGIFYSLKEIPRKILEKLRAKYIFTVSIYDYDELFFVLEEYIQRNYSHKPAGLEASYKFDKNGLSKKEGKDKKIYYKQEANIFFVKYKGKTVYFSKEKKELDHAQTFASVRSFSYKISAWMGKEVVKSLLEEITHAYNRDVINDKTSIFISNFDNWKNCDSKKVKPLDNIIFNKNDKKLLIDDLNEFINSNAWYLDVNITYKRTYLLFGPPGTGKTTLAQGIASYMSLDICILNLSSVREDSYLIYLFSNIPEKCILLIEDIDCAFTKRDSENKITLSCLLNCLDGIASKDGLITVITTNHKDKLDPALLRAGRADVHIEMPLAGSEEIEEYVNLFYRNTLMVPNNLLLNMSAVQEFCIQNKDNPEKAINLIIKQSNKNQEKCLQELN